MFEFESSSLNVEKCLGPLMIVANRSQSAGCTNTFYLLCIFPSFIEYMCFECIVGTVGAINKMRNKKALVEFYLNHSSREFKCKKRDTCVFIYYIYYICLLNATCNPYLKKRVNFLEE